MLSLQEYEDSDDEKPSKSVDSSTIVSPPSDNSGEKQVLNPWLDHEDSDQEEGSQEQHNKSQKTDELDRLFRDVENSKCSKDQVFKLKTFSVKMPSKDAPQQSDDLSSRTDTISLTSDILVGRKRDNIATSSREKSNRIDSKVLLRI